MGDAGQEPPKIDPPLGMYPGRLDDRGRLKLPANFLQYFADLGETRLFVTSLDRRIARLYTIPAWRETEKWLVNFREDTEAADNIAFNAADLGDVLTYGGFWRFLRRYPSMCWYELRRSFSRALFCRSLARLVPEIQPDDLATGGSGVRAQAITPEGDLVQDFHFIVRANALHVLNAPSPAATASLAIGAEIAGMVPAAS